MHCQKKEKIEERFYIGGAAKKKEKKKKKKRVRRCTKHIDYNKACDL